MLVSDYRRPQHQRALGSAGTAPATGNLPSKVTASPEAPQRAHSKTKSCECLQVLIQRPPKSEMLLILTHFLVIRPRLPNSLFWSYLHIHRPINLISLNLFQLPPTELLNSAYLELFTSQRVHHTAWRGLPGFICPKPPGNSTMPWENSTPNAFFPANGNIWICSLQAMSSLLYAKWQHQTRPRTRPKHSHWLL